MTWKRWSLLFLPFLLAAACTSRPAVESVWTECGSVAEPGVSAVDVTTKSTGKVVRFAVGPYTKYLGKLQGISSLSAGVAVRIDAARSSAGWRALAISANQCGAASGFQLACEGATGAARTDEEPGTSRTTQSCSVTSSGGFYGAVDLSCENAPPEVSCTFDPNPLTTLPNGTRTSTLTVEHQAAGAYPGGTYGLTVTALTAGGARQVFQLQVSLPPSAGEPPSVLASGNGDGGSGPRPAPGTSPGASPGAAATPVAVATTTTTTKPPPAPPGYSLDCSPGSLVAPPGGHASGVCAVGFTGGFQGPVQLECSSPLAGVTCTMKPDRLVASAGGPTVVGTNLQVAVTDGVTAGKYTMNVKATAKTSNRSAALSLNVAPVIRVADFALSCSASELAAGPKGMATTTCAVTRVSGFEAPVALSCAGLPAGVTCAFGASGSRLPPGGPTTTDVVMHVGDKVAPGTYAFQILGVGGALSRSSSVRLRVLEQ